jgi:beta-glucosidase
VPQPAPVVVLLSNGRPLPIPELAEGAAILETWMLGVEAGNTLADVMFGKYSPAGRLPAAFPRATGAVPFNYSANATGRPADPDLSRDTVRYHDLPITPLYPFGHGSPTASSVTRTSCRAQARSAWRAHRFRSRSRTSAVLLPISRAARARSVTIARPTLELRGFKRVELGASA